MMFKFFIHLSIYLPFSDLALKELVGIADSLYNLQEVIKFCKAYLPSRCLHMTLDDLFYTNENLKPNILTFVAELFFMFEITKADCVRQPPPASTVDAQAINNGNVLLFIFIYITAERISNYPCIKINMNF